MTTLSPETKKHLANVFAEFGRAKSDVNFNRLLLALTALHESLRLRERIEFPLYEPARDML